MADREGALLPICGAGASQQRFIDRQELQVADRNRASVVARLQARWRIAARSCRDIRRPGFTVFFMGFLGSVG